MSCGIVAALVSIRMGEKRNHVSTDHCLEISRLKTRSVRLWVFTHAEKIEREQSILYYSYATIYPIELSII